MAMFIVAKENDEVTGIDTRIVLVPSPTGAVPTPTPLPFAGAIGGGLSGDVYADGVPAAVVSSVAHNLVAHVAPSGAFETPPSNQGTIDSGSASVLVNGKPLARAGSVVVTCNDSEDLPNGTVIATGTVYVGD